MVAHQILVLLVGVRIPVRQPYTVVDKLVKVARVGPGSHE